MVARHLWIGRPRNPGPDLQNIAVKVFNVGGWLTHGDFALEVDIGFLAAVEHRLIPTRVRSEWSRLRAKGLAFVWAPVSQESSHVGHAGVGLVNVNSAPVALPCLATAQSQSFFDCDRAVRCLLPLGEKRFMHLVVIKVLFVMLSNLC